MNRSFAFSLSFLFTTSVQTAPHHCWCHTDLLPLVNKTTRHLISFSFIQQIISQCESSLQNHDCLHVFLSIQEVTVIFQSGLQWWPDWHFTTTPLIKLKMKWEKEMIHFIFHQEQRNLMCLNSRTGRAIMKERSQKWPLAVTEAQQPLELLTEWHSAKF